jgi:hypothetical protein
VPKPYQKAASAALRRHDEEQGKRRILRQARASRRPISRRRNRSPKASATTRSVARQNGFDFGLGEKQNIVRYPHIAKTREEFDDRLRKYDLDIYKNFYGPFFPQLPQGDDATSSRA